jgi:hypothetical protein
MQPVNSYEMSVSERNTNALKESNLIFLFPWPGPLCAVFLAFSFGVYSIPKCPSTK